MGIGGETPLPVLPTPPVAEPTPKEARLNLDMVVQATQMQSMKQLQDMVQASISIMVDIGGIRGARTKNIEKRPTLDVLMRIWEVGLPPVSDEVQ